jgi:predicted CopG family antitoxin
MKTVNVTFEDKEYRKLIEKKGELSWHNFIMTLVNAIHP